MGSDSITFSLIFIFVIFMWIFSSVPLFVTGILGVCLSVFFQISTISEAFLPFASPIIFLFLSGFIIACALEKTQLDQLIAESILSHPFTQRTGYRVIFCFLALSFVCSMWISNTATVAMLLPLSYGVIKSLKENFGLSGARFEERFLLCIAYSATLGGSMTPVGSPPNAVAMGMLNSNANTQLSFFDWMLLASPVGILGFFVTYYICIKNTEVVSSSRSKFKKVFYKKNINNEQRWVISIFLSVVFLWIFPSLYGVVNGDHFFFVVNLKSLLPAAGVGMFFSCFLFFTPLNSKIKVLNSKDLGRIDWSSLLLFGSGLSLGKMLFKTGIAKSFAQTLSSFSNNFGVLAIVVVLILAVIFFTEIASNTASANIVIPLMIALSESLGLSSSITAFCFAIACNSAFMLPVATPPNVIVYGSNRVTKGAMMKNGLILNIVSFMILSLVFIVSYLL